MNEGSCFASSFNLSPDSRWLAFVSCGLRVVDITGVRSERADFGDRRHESPHGQGPLRLVSRRQASDCTWSAMATYTHSIWTGSKPGPPVSLEEGLPAPALSQSLAIFPRWLEARSPVVSGPRLQMFRDPVRRKFAANAGRISPSPPDEAAPFLASEVGALVARPAADSLYRAFIPNSPRVFAANLDETPIQGGRRIGAEAPFSDSVRIVEP